MKPNTPGGLISAALLIGTLLSTGCSTLIKQSYEGDPTASNMKLASYSGTTAVYGSTNLEGDGRELVKEDYARIGVSKFLKDGRVSYEELKSEADDVGADVVLFSVKLPGSPQYLPPVALKGDGTPYTLAPFIYPSSAPVPDGYNTAADPNSAAIKGQQYEYTLSFWRKAPNS